MSINGDSLATRPISTNVPAKPSINADAPEDRGLVDGGSARIVGLLFRIDRALRSKGRAGRVKTQPFNEKLGDFTSWVQSTLVCLLVIVFGLSSGGNGDPWRGRGEMVRGAEFEIKSSKEQGRLAPASQVWTWPGSHGTATHEACLCTWSRWRCHTCLIGLTGNSIGLSPVRLL